MSTSLKVQDIGTSKLTSSEFPGLFFYFFSKNNVVNLIYALLHYKIYLVEGFCTNLLISNNIKFFEAIVINLGMKTALINIYRMTININVKQ